MRKAVLGLLIVGLLLAAAYVLLGRMGSGPVNSAVWRFVFGGRGQPDPQQSFVTVDREPCPGAPFIVPSEGVVGLLYGDPRGPYSAAAPHQGIDIFSQTEPGVTPVYAAYDGYITREANWRSALIQRIPDDPLQPGRTIWLYYAHMADREGNSFIDANFPPGVSELFVPRGTLLGYTGDYNGSALRDIWVHLHFSIVLDDGSGRYSNELEFVNTLDPSPYLGLPLHDACRVETIQCVENPVCSP